MNPTKIVLGILAAALAVWLFCIGLVAGSKKAKIDIQKARDESKYVAVGQTVRYSVPDVTNSGNTTAADEPQPADEDETQPKKTSKKSTKKSTKKKTATEITDVKKVAKLYVDAINKTKSLTDFTLTREDTLNLVIDEATGGSIVKSFANSFASSQTPHSVETLKFVNGRDVLGSDETPLVSLPPITDYASLDPDGLTFALATANEYGGYNISLGLADEMQTMQAPAPNHSGTMEVIQVSALGLPSVINILQLDIYYSGATINAATDSEGRLITMTHFLPVSHADGTGRAIGITAKMKLHGDFTSVYTVVY